MPETRKRAVRIVLANEGGHDGRGTAIQTIASKIGCSQESQRRRLIWAEIDAGTRGGISSEERDRIKSLEREVRELRQTDEILRKASAYFPPLSRFASRPLPGSGTELDRPFKR